MPREYAIASGRRWIIRVLVTLGTDARDGLGTARSGAGGGSEEFPELPSRRKCEAVVAILGELPVPLRLSVHSRPGGQTKAPVTTCRRSAT